MVKIKRGDHETKVSMDSYNTVFKPLGYALIEENKIKVEIPKKTETVKPVPDKKKKKQED